MRRLEQGLTGRAVHCASRGLWGNQVACLQGLLQSSEARETPEYLVNSFAGKRRKERARLVEGTTCAKVGTNFQRPERARCGCWSMGRMWGEMVTESEVGMRL